MHQLKSIFLSSLALIFSILPAFGVNSTVENSNDDGAGSLREAIAGIDPDSDNTITFAEGLSGATIALAGELLISLNGGGSVTIDAESLAEAVTLDGANQTRLFRITGGATTLRNLSLTRGLPSAAQVAASSADGGAILASGGAVLEVENCRIFGNSAKNGAIDSIGGNGGGIACTGTLRIRNSEVEDNFSGFGGGQVAVGPGRSGNGGGIWVTGTLGLFDSEVQGNLCNPSGVATGATLGVRGGNGGGIFVDGDALIERSLISGNTAGRGSSSDSGAAGGGGHGGGLYFRGNHCEIYDSTLRGNVAGRGSFTETGASGGTGGNGGGIFLHSGTIEVERCRIVENEHGAGGERRISGEVARVGDAAGLFVQSVGAQQIHNSIVARNVGAGVILASAGSISHVHVTVFGNVGVNGAGIVRFAGAIGFRDSISAGNGEISEEGVLLENNAEGEIQFLGENLIGGSPLLNSDVSVMSDAFLVPLPNSPAVNRADTFPGTPEIDVRNEPRNDGLPDIGAAEANWRPDQRAGKRKNPLTHKGNDIYNGNGAGQKAKMKIRGRKGKAYLSAQSDGDTDHFRMRGRGVNRKMGLRMFRLDQGRANVTGAVKRNRTVARSVANGEVVRFQLESKPKSSVNRLNKKVKFQLTSEGAPGTIDVAEIRVIKR